MIQVENLTKYYGNLAAIKDVSFSVERDGQSRLSRSPAVSPWCNRWC